LEDPILTVRVSSKFQITIPQEIRDALALKPGEELHTYLLDKSIRIGRPRSTIERKGIAKGMVWKDDDGDRNDRF
jgi:AbrB family looped-hinge helix DNA binding protein